MIRFKPITLADKALIETYTLPYGPPDCEYAFANMFGWHFLNRCSYAVIDHFMVIKYRKGDGSSLFLTPIGEGDKRGVIRQLDDLSRKAGERFCIRGNHHELQEILEKYAPGHFHYHVNRDYFDYVYLKKNLMELTGKNYQPKRNHVNKFKKEYLYRFTPLTPDMLPYCMQLEEEWCKKRHCMEIDSMKCEHQAFLHVMNNYEALGMIGGAIWVNDKIVAFSLGSPINNNTFDVQFEKADTDIDGAYSIINKEFSSYIPAQYIYLNREEDLGIEGLRKAKLSYHPAFMVEKCVAEKE